MSKGKGREQRGASNKTLTLQNLREDDHGPKAKKREEKVDYYGIQD